MISFFRLLKRNLAYYRKPYIALFLGVFTGAAVLTGALVTGDSVNYSLDRIRSLRLGKVRYSVSTGGRLFNADLAAKLEKDLAFQSTAALQLRGSVIKDGGQFRVNGVDVYGVDPGFWDMAEEPEALEHPGEGEVILNARLARRLDAAAGDELLIRMENLQPLPRDQLFSSDEDLTVTYRCLVKSIVSEEGMGRFNLAGSQETPLNLFLSRAVIGELLGSSHYANLVLSGDGVSRKEVEEGLGKFLTLADRGYFLKKTGDDTELQSERVFIEPQVAEIIDENWKGSHPSVSYFVNRFEFNRRLTPYSFISSWPFGGELEDSEIILTDWLARDLGAGVGDRISLAYFVPGAGGSLVEEVRTLRVRKILPVTEALRSMGLTPVFPGLSGVENCRDWNTDVPVDLSLIRDKDEKYWDDFGSTPKAFVSLSLGVKLWGNRFGDFTAYRFTGQSPEEVEKRLLSVLPPGQTGFQVQDQYTQTVRGTVDFGQLFLSLSFFLIAGSLLICGMLFSLELERRSPEIGILRAQGHCGNWIGRLFLAEGLVVGGLGSLAGALGGIGYTSFILWGLKGLWNGAVGTSSLRLHISLLTLGEGFFINLLLVFLVIFRSVRFYGKKEIHLLAAGFSREEFSPGARKIPLAFTVISFLAAVICYVLYLRGIIRGEEFIFFLLAFFILIFLLSGLYLFLSPTSGRSVFPSTASLGLGNIRRRRKRSFGVTAVLTLGIFTVLAVGANRKAVSSDQLSPSGGTGGFSYAGETTIPLLSDFLGDRKKILAGLDREKRDSVNFVPFKVRRGEDASCLNLNRVENPGLLGVRPESLAGTFHFTALLSGGGAGDPWKILTRGGDRVFAVVDQGVLTWGLGLKLGDSLRYVNEEGREIEVVLAGTLSNSLFQGSLIISEENMNRHFPSVSGYNFFLVDSPVDQDLENVLSRRLREYGLDLEQAYVRLDRYNSVENAYLSIFLILGALALLIGTFGLGIIVYRNVEEDRGRLALLDAIGFRKWRLLSILLWEQVPLLFCGLVFGALSAGLSLFPGFLEHRDRLPLGFMGWWILFFLLNGLFWIIFSAWRGLEQKGGLREE